MVKQKLKQGGDEGVQKWVDESLERRKTAEKGLRRAGGQGDEDVAMD